MTKPREEPDWDREEWGQSDAPPDRWGRDDDSPVWLEPGRIVSWDARTAAEATAAWVEAGEAIARAQRPV